MNGFQDNYIFTILKFILFLFLLAFLSQFTVEFFNETKLKGDFSEHALFFSVLTPFIFYMFCGDLNSLYKRSQQFFFRSQVLMLMFPALLIFTGLGFLIIPRIFNLSYGNNIFVFLGGALSVMHLIFIAKEIKGTSFSGYISYLFNFSILYILILLFFVLYLRVTFNLDIGAIVINGIKGGADLIKDIFLRIFR
ncbi:MAG: hypothetical protein PHP69_03750 [Candidatus Omnitrophica bacterium]|nr:hypothetical protein [Candidatus Omnitrophota bacterium]MDD5080570.1 hypothetical protein [Candidatus Omnitrophota bacterium]MDD5441079.1 hypothetical protein [Candidatus Omnitrophota bacterium]